jgi:hypothetical protein
MFTKPITKHGIAPTVLCAHNSPFGSTLRMMFMIIRTLYIVEWIGEQSSLDDVATLVHSYIHNRLVGPRRPLY